MKTIEEKAKRYDEAYKVAESIHRFSSNPAEIKRMEEIFPSLKEYEGERIRNVLIGWINLESSISFGDTFDGFSKEQILAWLEKQEDKDSQVKLPTFTFDDILALQCCMETVKKVQEDKDLYEKLNDLHGRVYDAYHLEKQGEQKPADKIEPKFKVGDWIVHQGTEYIYQVVTVIDNYNKYVLKYGDNYTIQKCTDVDKCTRLWTIQDAKEGDILVDNLGNVCIYQEPSTKLMYHSYCYGNHKDFMCIRGSHEIVGSYPATKEQRDKLGKAMADAGYVFDFEKKELKEIENEEYDGDDYGIDSLWHAKNILKKTLGKVDGYQSDDGILEHKCAISAVDKLYKHEPAWCAEDTFMVQRIYKYLDTAKKYYVDRSEVRECIDWLKSIKERFTWKPSDEQINALNAINVTGGISYAGQG